MPRKKKVTAPLEPELTYEQHVEKELPWIQETLDWSFEFQRKRSTKKPKVQVAYLPHRQVIVAALRSGDASDHEWLTLQVSLISEIFRNEGCPLELKVAVLS